MCLLAIMGKNNKISIEKLHLIAGVSLIISGIMVYFLDRFENALSWIIFGAMYISMSDIGENEMSEAKQNHPKHLVRRAFGYLGAIFSVALVIIYFSRIFL